MNASDVMSAPVVTVSPAAPVLEVAGLLRERRISGVPVVEQGRVLGVVSEDHLLQLDGQETGRDARTLWQRLLHPGPPSLQPAAMNGLRAADIMSRGAISVGEYTPLADLAAVFAGQQVHRVMVLGGEHLVGIITGSDVMQALLALSHASSGDWRADAAIEARLGAALQAQEGWNPLVSHVSVDKGIVWFSGMVESEAARDAARLAAEGTPGVCGVLDDRICAATCQPWSSAQALEYVSG